MDDSKENPNNVEVFVSDRKEHPYRIWDSIHAAPAILEACLHDNVINAAKRAAREINHRKINWIVFTGTGSSHNSSIYGVYALAELANMRSKYITSYEFANYPQGNFGSDSALVGISHSGGTEALLQSIEKVKDDKAYIIGITDVPTSPLAKLSDEVLIGPGERGMAIPSTRSYLADLFCTFLLNLAIGEEKHPGVWKKWIDHAKKVPEFVRDSIEICDQVIPDIAYKYAKENLFYVVSDGPNYATAVDGALKIQEISWKSGLPYQAEEAIHGPLLGLEADIPLILIAAEGNGYERVERIARGMSLLNSPIISIAKTNASIEQFSRDFIGIDGNIPELLTPFTYIIPLFEFAYWISVHNGNNPDSLRLQEPDREKILRILEPVGSH